MTITPLILRPSTQGRSARVSTALAPAGCSLLPEHLAVSSAESGLALQGTVQAVTTGPGSVVPASSPGAAGRPVVAADAGAAGRPYSNTSRRSLAALRRIASSVRSSAGNGAPTTVQRPSRLWSARTLP